ncbi:MAG: ABC transporter ATP-binding protein [Phycisphaerales bacterium]|nr:ABC transporter ATP-binding protein [Phycisphaerales bacterium]
MVPISIQHVVKTFGRVRALDDVSLEIERGELFFLLGPSGCGKTTLLRSIAGFYTPDSGSIRFGERDVTTLPPQKRNTGMMFQNYALWPHMSVEANVAFGLKVRSVARAERSRRVAEALAMVRMSEYAKRKPNQLSGGQQQRVALARAMVIRPQCLLLDEPLSNLDAKLRLEMRSEIRRLCKEFNLTGVYVTHDQKEALSMADRMAVMFKGRVAQLGPPEELYCKPLSADVADFLGETNFLDATALDVSSEGQRFRTAAGDLLSANGRAAKGARCRVSIRPEALQIAAIGDSAARREADVNHVEGVVRERVYLGEAAQLELAVGSTILRLNLTERADRPEIGLRSPMAVSVDPRDVIVLSA